MAGPNNGGRARGYEALRESEELHRATLSSISDAVFLADDDGVFTYICPNVDVIFGYVPDEVRSMGNIGRLLGEDLFDPVELAAKGEICNVEREITRKSGERRTVLVLLKKVSIKGGTVLYTCRDITQLRLAESELAATRLSLTHAGRLAILGQLMASIMHEIRQPLTSIELNSSTVLSMLADQGEAVELNRVREIFDDIRRGSSDAVEIIDRLNNLVRKKPLELRWLDPNEIVSSTLSLIARDAERRGMLIRAELAPTVATVRADRIALQHVLLDLIVNAMDAMDGSEKESIITVTTRSDRGAVEIAVSDTGPGIPARHGSKLFEPFFSTKPEGIGLGLAIARSIVEAHGGQISVDERDGSGATFRVTLPVGSVS